MKFIVLAIAVVLSGCAVGVAPTDNGNSNSILPKTCKTVNSKYEVVFTKLDGDCPQDTAIGYIWLDSDGNLNLPLNCTDHGQSTACTNFLDETCNTWLYKENMTGELDWSPAGTSAHGYLTYTTFELQSGKLSCSSVYETTYTLQWTAE